ncbi:DUF6150 family protein [Flavobacterium sp. DG1-102-2]|uniref:DUF6150 family protein n=1 Tax=Flavobacterium sp. DG1-102-2 TaxID=3081663 RepID=UPI00294A6879|nr:DUF6150 family protein [Flavobacterium sp. DG1-102-2]MDV6167882.1 DUF6150 family protein [Flavobacterium sp. DG1-102-2]
MARIYQTSSMGEAHVRLCIVSNREEADLLVHRVSSWGLAHGDSLWYITKDKQDATCWVCFTSRGMAEVSICFVNTVGESGWLKPHRLKGRFAK